jgi:bifunctional non-homologous end joining protein LigD
LRQEFIIVGYSDPPRGERALGALYLGYRKNDALQYAGKVGRGFTMKSAEELAARMDGDWGDCARAERRRIEGGSLGKTGSAVRSFIYRMGRRRTIRHRSFQGLREDKNASQVSKETPVAPAVRTASAEGKQAERLVLHGITITHPDRVISDIGHITKGELAEYYAAVATRILPQIVRHPLSLLRCPQV